MLVQPPDSRPAMASFHLLLRQHSTASDVGVRSVGSSTHKAQRNSNSRKSVTVEDPRQSYPLDVDVVHVEVP